MNRSDTFRLDCRLAGLSYLGLAITGILGFLMVRSALFAAGDPARTLANLVEREGLARIGVALELGIAMCQALAAVWFAKLFRETDAFAAGVLALFGMVNAVVVLASAAMMGAALDVAHGPSGADPSASHLVFLLSGWFWQVGNIFFGLWLVPMGWLTWKASFGPRALGWILIVGGAGYILNAFIAVLVPDASSWVGLFAVPATIGEFWMIGLLFWTGLRPARAVNQ
jgi:hypothetical protein